MNLKTITDTERTMLYNSIVGRAIKKSLKEKGLRMKDDMSMSLIKDLLADKVMEYIQKIHYHMKHNLKAPKNHITPVYILDALGLDSAALTMYAQNPEYDTLSKFIQRTGLSKLLISHKLNLTRTTLEGTDLNSFGIIKLALVLHLSSFIDYLREVVVNLCKVMTVTEKHVKTAANMIGK